MWGQTKAFFDGASDAAADDFTLGTLPNEKYTGFKDYSSKYPLSRKAGEVAGNLLGLVVGEAETAIGAGGAAIGRMASVTEGGKVVGVPLTGGSVAVAAHGVSMSTKAALGTGKSASEFWNMFANHNGTQGTNKAATQESSDHVTYYRVQRGIPPNASWERIKKKDDGSITIQKGVNVNISTGNIDHAKYFLNEKRPGGEIVAFDIPKWLDDFVKETVIPQFKYNTNKKNQGGSAPKIVDPTTPGDSYEFPPIWSEWFEEHAKNGRIIKGAGD